jgi:hypothetical protein
VLINSTGYFVLVWSALGAGCWVLGAPYSLEPPIFIGIPC